MKRMKPLEDRPDLTCCQGDVWPPIHAKVYGPDPENSRGIVSNEDYERLRYWHRACGLFQIQEGKCLKCPHVVVNGRKIREANPKVKASPSNRNVMKQ